jgi:NAD(P)-dependent dehydrogenase (short-subunit alcohol dehydrogenase family)
MEIDLSGRTALVTGSGAGIGRAIAAGLHAAGATVVVNDLREEAVAAAIERLGGGERLRGIAADLGSAEGCEAVFAKLPAFDVLVNNVGVAAPTPVFEIADEEWNRLFAVNVMSGVRMARAYVPGMVARGWGRAIFISSECGLQIPPEMVHYGVSKAAILAVARGFAESVAGSGVTVNSVVPGPTRTEGSEAFMRGALAEGDETSIEEIERRYLASDRPTSLLERFTAPEEIANLVVYLASDQASATTGAALRADGGVVRSLG